MAKGEWAALHPAMPSSDHRFQWPIKVIQGSNNKYIVNNIYNNSLLVNGVLTVKDIRILDIDENYNDIYNQSLYDPQYGGTHSYSVTALVS